MGEEVRGINVVHPKGQSLLEADTLSHPTFGFDLTVAQ